MINYIVESSSHSPIDGQSFITARLHTLGQLESGKNSNVFHHFINERLSQSTIS